MATTKDVNINNPQNYKPCRKKQYEIWACMPPAGTIVVNALEQPDAVRLLGKRTYFTGKDLAQLQQRNPTAIAQLQGMIQRGQIYCTKPGDMVLSGTRGELWVTNKDKVARTYQVFLNGGWCQNWAGLFQERGIKRGDAYFLPWVKVRAGGEQASTTMACFVPKSQRGQIKTSWAVLNYNAPGVEHGLGDFILCAGTQGKPNLSDRWVVNGAVFADTYNNQGWAGCIQPSGEMYSPPEPAPLFEVESEDSNTEFSQELYNFVGQLAQKCSQMQHKELAFRAEKGKAPNEIILKAKTVMDFAAKNSTSDFKVVGVQTVVTINSDNTVTFVNRLMSGGGEVGSGTMFKICVPKEVPKGEKLDPSVTAQFLRDNVEVIFGLCGFVKEVGIRNSFQYSEPLSKGDYDGIRDYTMTSGATNRLCRGLSSSGEQAGEGKASAIRTINNCDWLFDRVHTTRPLRVFRGEPFEQRVADNGANFDEMAGFTSVNTAYSSTTLNVQSAPMFAQNRGTATMKNGKTVKGGLIWAIDIPPGTRAHFAHTVAGWKQQFEILLDRCYDIQAGETILEFKDSNGCTYKVIRGSLVMHDECGPLDRQQSAMLYKAGKTVYDMDGRVPFAREYSAGVLHEAFNKIRQRGFSDVQWQDAFDSDKEILNKEVNTQTTSQLLDSRINVKAAIVLRTNNPDGASKDMVNDLAFVLEEGGKAIVIHKIRAKAGVRQDHGQAEGLRWSQYGINYMKVDKTYDADGKVVSVDGATDVNEFDQAAYGKVDKRQILYLKEGTSDEIASRIINYAKAHKNICLLPLLDVGRYFDQVFAQVITSEGYELMRSIRVERHYNKSSKSEASDPQAGFVPCKYQITGDNDDHLVIDVKFSRDKATKKLQIAYRGQSQGTKVSESKNISTDIFNNEKMYSLATSIIYTFAKRMHLSKARKFDRLLAYFCNQTGCRLVRCPQSKDAFKTYKIWGVDNKSHFNVDIFKKDVEKYQAVIEFDDGRVEILDMDFSDTIFALYRQFCLAVVGGDNNGDGSAQS